MNTAARGIDSEAALYSEDLPASFQLAYGWMKYAPRAKGWLPRRLGRTLGRGIKCSIRTRAGARLAVDPMNLDFYCLVKLRNGVWEQDVLDACLRVIQPGDVFYDIGANAGMVTLDVAKAFGPAVLVHSFEPQPTLAHSLAVSIALNEFAHVQLHEILLGDTARESEFFIADHAIHSSLIAREGGASPLKLRMETLDDLIAREKLPAPTVIKIDVEGAELQVLRGGLETFAAAPPALIFEADENMPRFGYGLADLIALFREICPAYSYYRIEGSEFAVLKDANSAALGNYLALPPGRSLRPKI